MLFLQAKYLIVINTNLMKKFVLLLVSLFLLGIGFAYSQSSNEPIVIDDAIIGHHFYHGDEEIKTVSKMKAIVANDQLALQEVKKAAVPEVFSYIFAFAGGFAMGWEIGGLLWGKFDPYIFAGGVGLAAVAFGFSAVANNQLLKGARIYNSNLDNSSNSNNVSLELGFVPGGVGLTLTF